MSRPRPRSQRFYRVKGGRRRRRRLTGWILGGALLSVTVWVLVFGETGWRRMHEEREEVQRLRERSQELRASTEQIESQIAEIRTEASPLLEKIAREEYLMKREGEEVFHVLEADSLRFEVPDLRATR